MLTAAELASMQSTQAAAMMDACKLLAPMAVDGDFGQESISYTAGSEIPCGFEPGTAARGGSVAGLVVELSARLRLRLSDGAAVTPDHRIEVTKRLGTTLSPTEVYQVVGWPKRGATCFVVEVRRVQ
ncbi:MAG TPA: hypothetical protein GYA08_01605 [Chloroflexi bacterium]|nr:hypothetical protein [Chloroflexota bacterium]